jgi:hypothetical protein
MKSRLAVMACFLCLLVTPPSFAVEFIMVRIDGPQGISSPSSQSRFGRTGNLPDNWARHSDALSFWIWERLDSNTRSTIQNSAWSGNVESSRKLLIDGLENLAHGPKLYEVDLF